MMLPSRTANSLFISASQRDREHERSIVRTMREHRVDGVILCSTPFSAEQSRQLHSYEIPVVVINNQSARDYPNSIYHDDLDGSRQVMRHLVSLGHRHIAYLGYPYSGRTNAKRLAGYQQEMLAASAQEVEILGIDDFWTEGPPAPAEAGPDALKDGLTKAELYLKYGLADKASEKLSQLAELAPNDLEIRQRLRDLCQRRGDRDGWVREQLHIAELHLAQKREGDALRVYQAILEVASDNVDARNAIQYLRPEALPPERAVIEIDVGGATVEFVQVEGQETAVRRGPRDTADAEDEA